MDSRPATLEHIAEVQKNIGAFLIEMGHRAAVHDQSKLESPEKEGFDEWTPKLKGLEYGSDEYKEALKGLGEVLKHHYANNRHHPEYGFQTEEWRSVVDYEGLYEVSTFGRIKRLARLAERPGPAGNMRIAEKMLALNETPKGYLRVQLSNGDGKKNHLVHRLVATAFIENQENKPFINHRDGDKKNNKVTNIEWSTASENELHAYELGLKKPEVKYFVHCLDLDIVTRGCCKMEQSLHENGYEAATAGGIYAAMDRGSPYLGLMFEGYPISEGSPHSMMRDMNLADLVECLIDWYSASKRHATGDIVKSIEINQQRYGYSDDLKQIFLNTARDFGWTNSPAIRSE